MNEIMKLKQLTGVIGKDGKPVGLTGLPNHWREDITHCMRNDCSLTTIDVAEDQLRATLPTWTLITDDPDTWPEDAEEIVYRFHHQEFGWGSLYAIQWHHSEMNNGISGAIWWPICGLFKRPDHPPQDK